MLEEERRLAYVGMTRAQERLTLTHASSRSLWGAGTTTCRRASSTSCRTSGRARAAAAHVLVGLRRAATARAADGVPGSLHGRQRPSRHARRGRRHWHRAGRGGHRSLRRRHRASPDARVRAARADRLAASAPGCVETPSDGGEGGSCQMATMNLSAFFAAFEESRRGRDRFRRPCCGVAEFRRPPDSGLGAGPDCAGALRRDARRTSDPRRRQGSKTPLRPGRAQDLVPARPSGEARLRRSRGPGRPRRFAGINGSGRRCGRHGLGRSARCHRGDR